MKFKSKSSSIELGSIDDAHAEQAPAEEEAEPLVAQKAADTEAPALHLKINGVA